jgi:hypothetical protein
MRYALAFVFLRSYLRTYLGFIQAGITPLVPYHVYNEIGYNEAKYDGRQANRLIKVFFLGMHIIAIASSMLNRTFTYDTTLKILCLTPIAGA